MKLVRPSQRCQANFCQIPSHSQVSVFADSASILFCNAVVMLLRVTNQRWDVPTGKDEDVYDRNFKVREQALAKTVMSFVCCSYSRFPYVARRTFSEIVIILSSTMLIFCYQSVNCMNDFVSESDVSSSDSLGESLHKAIASSLHFDIAKTPVVR